MKVMPVGSKIKQPITSLYSKVSSRFKGKSILLRKFKIKTRLIASFVLLLIVMLLVTSIFSYSSSTNTMNEKVRIDSLQVMGQTSVILNNEIKRMEDYFLDIGLNAAVQDALSKYTVGNKFEQLDQSRKLKSFLSIKFASSNDIAYCGIFHGNSFTQEEAYNTASVTLDVGAISKKDLKQLEWSDFKVDPSNSNITSYYGIQQNIASVTDKQKVMAKMVLIPKNNYLANAFEKLDIGIDPKNEKAFPIFVVDNDGRIIASRSVEEYPIGKATEVSALIAKNILKYNKKDSTGLEAGDFDLNIEGSTRMVTYSQIRKDKHLFVISIIPYYYLNSAANKLGINIFIIGVICVAIGFSLCLVIARSVSHPLNNLVQIMKKAKDGDLTNQIQDNEKDEIADVCRNYNDMLLNINSLVANVRNSTQCVLSVANKISITSKSTYSASEQVAVTAEQIAKGASDQAAEINESVGNIEQLSKGITLVENDIVKVMTLANKIKNLNTDVLKTIDTLNLKSTQVSETTDKVSTNIYDLSKSMQEIQKILKIMNSISEQINLLSLNATIEAARAGESGKGFAVVANEVRKLADKSKEFTGSIGNIIGSIEQKTNVTVEQVKNSDIAVNEQKIAVKQTEELFSMVFSSIEIVLNDITRTEKSVASIVRSKGKVLEAMENISAVAEESAATTEMISASTEEQFASAEELSNNASDLESLSLVLNNELDKFKTE